MILSSKKLKFKILFWFVLGQLCYLSPLLAVPKNNTCGSATYIKNVRNWCSSPAQFTNVGATDSGVPRPERCFTSMMERNNDVWFKFTAVGNIANISVIGQLARSPKGTLQKPQFVLYQGDCANLKKLTCHSDNRGNGITEAFGYDMIIGATYYIRVDGWGIDMGTFQLCVNNYNEVPSPSSDCSTAVVLCDKSAFTVPSVIGSGKYRESLEGTCLIAEESSTWYKFTCDKPGTLTFTLKPINPSDDIDFAVYKLPNGMDDCSRKFPVRCMASGDHMPYSKCAGATGLKTSASDISEEPGCYPYDDNFVAALGMEAGMSYAILIQNDNNTGNGFSIEFGGTGTFVGPKAWFKVSKLKIPKDSVMWARDVSTFPGGIAKWEWNFGENASKSGSKRRGPHSFSFSKPGKKSIRLTVETKNGCRVTAVRKITVIDSPPPPPPPPVEPEVMPETPPIATNPSDQNLTTSTDASPPIIQKDTLIKPTPSSPVLEQVPAEEETFTTTTTTKTETETTTETVTTRKVKKYWRIKRVGILYHPSDSFNIATEHLEVMNEMVELLKETPTTIAYIEGHTNNIPHNNYCKELSEKRSVAAMNYLISKGISADRLTNKIIGKSKPKDSNKSKYGRKRNQRVEIKILYPTDKITD
jgi:outer membrane protein OmpA-like peptidoglycan-associated protein